MTPIPEYNHTDWALPVGCYSILVWHDAIIRSFPGGTREFERVHRPKRKSWLLYLVMALTEEHLAEILGELEQAGLVPGVDVAVGNRVREPLLDCPGIMFSSKGMMRWSITVTARPGDLEDLQDALAASIAAHDGHALTAPQSGSGGDPGHSSSNGQPAASPAPTGTPRHTTVTGLTRKADRRQFISDLGSVLDSRTLYRTLTIREGDTHTSIDIEGWGLFALVTLDHRRRGEVPLVHWHGASRELIMAPNAWSRVNRHHRRKATSFPKDLNGVIGCLYAGLWAALHETAFRQGGSR